MPSEGSGRPLLLSVRAYGRVLRAPARHHALHRAHSVAVRKPGARLQPGDHRVDALAGFGMFLLARDLTGRGDAALVAGAPSRVRPSARRTCSTCRCSCRDGCLSGCGRCTASSRRARAGPLRLRPALRAAGVVERLLPVFHGHTGRDRGPARRCGCGREALGRTIAALAAAAAAILAALAPIAAAYVKVGASRGSNAMPGKSCTSHRRLCRIPRRQTTGLRSGDSCCRPVATNRSCFPGCLVTLASRLPRAARAPGRCAVAGAPARGWPRSTPLSSVSPSYSRWDRPRR